MKSIDINHGRLSGGRIAVLCGLFLAVSSGIQGLSGHSSGSSRLAGETIGCCVIQVIDASAWPVAQSQPRQKERDAMVRVIAEYGLQDSDVLKAMARVPRHEFVPARYSAMAYDDTPLPIGHGQTISQPFIVAEMTRLLKLTEDARVLEIGTGSAYQAAVLAEFTRQVFTIEIIEPLMREAEKRLQKLGYSSVKVRHGDGYYGWSEEGPFDSIIVTAAAGEIPPPLVQQLKEGGRMVIPVGSTLGTQSLMLVEKDKKGKVRTRSLMPVRFVPLVRKDQGR